MPSSSQTVARKSWAVDLAVLDDAGAFLVGLADDLAALDAAAQHGQAPGPRVVVAARLGAAGVDVRRAAELAHPDHQRAVEQAAVLQVVDQRGDRRVDLPGERLDAVEVVLVRVPAAEASPRRTARPTSTSRRAIRTPSPNRPVPYLPRLAVGSGRQVERLRLLRLHQLDGPLVGRLVVGDRVGLVVAVERLLHLLEQADAVVELPAGDERPQVLDAAARVGDEQRLVLRPEEAGAVAAVADARRSSAAGRRGLPSSWRDDRADATGRRRRPALRGSRCAGSTWPAGGRLPACSCRGR